MEVQKHPHHVAHKKKFGEYLLEFTMLFLAVFLGFVAENIREHQVEKNREREYMVTMLEDLRADLPLLDSTIVQWERANMSIDSLADAVTSSVGTKDLTKAYRHLNEALNAWGFRYNDRTIAQLKHAGGFRLIRNEKVANSIIAYDQFNNNAVEGIATFHYSLYNDAVRLRNKVFAQAVINKISDRYHAGLIPPSADPWIDSMIVANRVPLKTEDLNALMFEFKNAILAYRQDYGNMKWGYGNLRDRQKGLIELINKEYHLE